MNLRDKRRVFLNLEQLEDRSVPATIAFVNGTLSITNPTNAPGNLTLTQTANSTFSVNLGTGYSSPTFSRVSNILIDSGNGIHNTTIALGGLTYTGNLFINQHNGSDSVGINNGSILGNTTIHTGTGNDSVLLGNTGNDTFGGNVMLVNSSGNISITTGSDSVTFDSNLSIYNLGNGNVSVTLAATTQEKSNLSIYNLGNGNGSIAVSNSPGGLFELFAVGGGNNNVSLTPGTPTTWKIDWSFGAGHNTITLDNSGSTFIGTNHAAVPSNNTLNNPNWALPPFPLWNF